MARSVSGASTANDRLTVNGLGGANVIDASGVATGSILLTLDGGDSDDVLLGGPGNDTLDGGPGDNIVIQSLGADTVTSATTAGNDWLTTHARTISGKTVLDVGGKERTVPHVDLAPFARGVTSA